jgi:hypothetical protein
MEVKLQKLESFPEKVDRLKALSVEYKNLVLTKRTLSDAKKARHTLRNERYVIQNIRDKNKNLLNAMKRENNRIAEEMIGIIKPTEDEVDEKIKSVEAEIEAERERKRKEREERLKRQ